MYKGKIVPETFEGRGYLDPTLGNSNLTIRQLLFFTLFYYVNSL